MTLRIPVIFGVDVDLAFAVRSDFVAHPWADRFRFCTPADALAILDEA